jgi:hypothetical protein
MESRKIVYLMRGLSSSGKSHTAKQLAGQTGIVCETDEYFYTWLEEALAFTGTGSAI